MKKVHFGLDFGVVLCLNERTIETENKAMKKQRNKRGYNSIDLVGGGRIGYCLEGIFGHRQKWKVYIIERRGAQPKHLVDFKSETLAESAVLRFCKIINKRSERLLGLEKNVDFT